MKRALAVLSILSVVLLTGCFEIENSIELKQDLSGTVDVRATINEESAAIDMARMSRPANSAPLTAAERKKAKSDYWATSAASGNAPTREQFEAQLPGGVELLSYAFKNTPDLITTLKVKLRFQELGHLKPLNIGGSEMQMSNVETPFAALEVSESDDTVTIQSAVANPVETAITDPALRQTMAKMRVVYRIKAPFTVVSHNATRREGDTLVWEYDFATFEKMAKSGKVDDAQLRVTYRR